MGIKTPNVFVYTAALKSAISHQDLRGTIKLFSAWVPAIVILTSLPNTNDRHPWITHEWTIRDERVKKQGSVHRGNACYFVRWKRWHTSGMSIRIKIKLLCKHNFTGRCQTSGCWQWSQHRKEAQCSLFISVGWQSAWLSTRGKSPCNWEIIKQRTTYSVQCVECVNAGGEQVCSTDLTFGWCQHNKGNKAFHRARWWHIVLWLGLMLRAR